MGEERVLEGRGYDFKSGGFVSFFSIVRSGKFFFI